VRDNWPPCVGRDAIDGGLGGKRTDSGADRSGPSRAPEAAEARNPFFSVHKQKACVAVGANSSCEQAEPTRRAEIELASEEARARLPPPARRGLLR